MTGRTEILDADDMDRLPQADPGARFVAALMTAGARSFVDNANVETKALAVDGKIIPVLINSGNRGNGGVCSPHAHYIDCTLEELARRHPRLPPPLLKTLMLPLDAILRSGRIDNVAFINNWLLPTNPSPGLSSAQIAALTACLTARHPDLAIVFRSLNPRIDGPGCEALRRSGYRLVRSRRVYLLDTASGHHLDHDNARTDLRLLARTPYAILPDRQALGPHVRRMATLYRDLYLTKYSRLNPQLNERFFSLTLGEDILTYRALEKDGRVDGFVAYFVGDTVMRGVIIGYDRRLPRKLGLYRQLFAILIRDAAERKLLLHLSGGVGRFKQLRGAVPVEEFDAVYDRHLPPSRRLAWTCLRAVTGLWSRV